MQHNTGTKNVARNREDKDELFVNRPHRVYNLRVLVEYDRQRDDNCCASSPPKNKTSKQEVVLN